MRSDWTELEPGFWQRNDEEFQAQELGYGPAMLAKAHEEELETYGSLDEAMDWADEHHPMAREYPR